MASLDKEVADLARTVTVPASMKVDELAVEVVKFASTRAEAETNEVRAELRHDVRHRRRRSDRRPHRRGGIRRVSAVRRNGCMHESARGWASVRRNRRPRTWRRNRRHGSSHAGLQAGTSRDGRLRADQANRRPALAPSGSRTWKIYRFRSRARSAKSSNAYRRVRRALSKRLQR